jgi:hypothetical protein
MLKNAGSDEPTTEQLREADLINKMFLSQSSGLLTEDDSGQ